MHNSCLNKVEFGLLKSFYKRNPHCNSCDQFFIALYLSIYNANTESHSFENCDSTDLIVEPREFVFVWQAAYFDTVSKFRT